MISFSSNGAIMKLFNELEAVHRYGSLLAAGNIGDCFRQTTQSVARQRRFQSATGCTGFLHLRVQEERSRGIPKKIR